MLPSAQDVLAFWFAENDAGYWFASDAGFDAQLRERFGDLAEAAADGLLDGWIATPRAGRPC